MPRLIAPALALALALAPPLAAQPLGPGAAPDYPEAEGETAPPIEPMTLGRMMEILRALDPETEVQGPMARLTIAETVVLVVSDPRADRMRVMVPVRPAEGLSAEDLQRMMQANFDTALDARYAIAKGVVWATYIHPLGALGKEQLISGIGQTVNLAQTYGTLFTSGGLTFGGGDSRDLQRKLIEELQQKGQEI